MNNSKANLFQRSSKHKEDYQKRTLLIMLFWSSFVIVNYYSFWVFITSPANRLNFKSSTIDILSAFSPLKTQEDYISFILIGILPALSVAICIFGFRLMKLKWLSTKTVQFVLEGVIQEFNQKNRKVTDKILWGEITKVAFKKTRKAEILYIDICGEKDCKIRLYGLEPWEELIHKVEVICKDKNIELEESNARIGSRGYLLGSINFISILMTPFIALSDQLRILKLDTYANILLVLLGTFVSINMAFLTEPLETDRSKYKYFTIFFVLLWISIAVYLFTKK